jgi:catalase
MTFMTTASVLFDAVFVPGGQASRDALMQEMEAVHFVNEAFKHCKSIAAVGAGVDFVGATFAGQANGDNAVILGDNVAQDFIKAIAQHRNWERETRAKIPA